MAEAQRMSDDSDAEGQNYHLYKIRSSSKVPPATTSVVVINDKRLTTEVDTGSSLTIISKDTFVQHFNDMNMAA
jgi:hypothetical protein